MSGMDERATPLNAEEHAPFIPYADRQRASGRDEMLLSGTEERLGFLPNSFLLYLHQPHLLRDVTRLNNSVMRHPANLIPENLKYRLALLVSRNQGCRYCTAHEAFTLKRKWGLDDQRIDEILHLENPEDEREAAAWAYVHAASLGPEEVDQAIRENLSEHFTPPEIIEIACTLGFWSLYNRIHSSLDVPLEPHVAREAHWVDVVPNRES